MPRAAAADGLGRFKLTGNGRDSARPSTSVLREPLFVGREPRSVSRRKLGSTRDSGCLSRNEHPQPEHTGTVFLGTRGGFC